MDATEPDNLISKARQGDHAAFEGLTTTYRDRLRALVQSRLGTHLRAKVEVEDIVQETYLRAFRSLDRFRPEGADSFFRWLGGIANHVIHEAARQNKREMIVPLDSEVPGESTEHVSPSRAGMRNERFDRLQEALNSLSPDHRRVILLARIERLPMKEVARRMDRSPEVVTQLLWRALRKLKKSFGSTDSLHLPRRLLEDQGGQNGYTRPR